MLFEQSDTRHLLFAIHIFVEKQSGRFSILGGVDLRPVQVLRFDFVSVDIGLMSRLTLLIFRRRVPALHATIEVPTLGQLRTFSRLRLLRAILLPMVPIQ